MSCGCPLCFLLWKDEDAVAPRRVSLDLSPAVLEPFFPVGKPQCFA